MYQKIFDRYIYCSPTLLTVQNHDLYVELYRKLVVKFRSHQCTTDFVLKLNSQNNADSVGYLSAMLVGGNTDNCCRDAMNIIKLRLFGDKNTECDIRYAEKMFDIYTYFSPTRITTQIYDEYVQLYRDLIVKFYGHKSTINFLLKIIYEYDKDVWYGIYFLNDDYKIYYEQFDKNKQQDSAIFPELIKGLTNRDIEVPISGILENYDKTNINAITQFLTTSFTIANNDKQYKIIKYLNDNNYSYSFDFLKNDTNTINKKHNIVLCNGLTPLNTQLFDELNINNIFNLRTVLATRNIKLVLEFMNLYLSKRNMTEQEFHKMSELYGSVAAIIELLKTHKVTQFVTHQILDCVIKTPNITHDKMYETLSVALNNKCFLTPEDIMSIFSNTHYTAKICDLLCSFGFIELNDEFFESYIDYVVHDMEVKFNFTNINNIIRSILSSDHSEYNKNRLLKSYCNFTKKQTDLINKLKTASYIELIEYINQTSTKKNKQQIQPYHMLHAFNCGNYDLGYNIMTNYKFKIELYDVLHISNIKCRLAIYKKLFDI